MVVLSWRLRCCRYRLRRRALLQLWIQHESKRSAIEHSNIWLCKYTILEFYKNLSFDVCCYLIVRNTLSQYHFFFIFKLLAHELGHNFGMSHDFADKHGGDGGPCDGQGIMSYGIWKDEEWMLQRPNPDWTKFDRLSNTSVVIPTPVVVPPPGISQGTSPPGVPPGISGPSPGTRLGSRNPSEMSGNVPKPSRNVPKPAPGLPPASAVNQWRCGGLREAVSIRRTLPPARCRRRLDPHKNFVL